LIEALEGADVLIGVSGPNLATAQDIGLMQKGHRVRDGESNSGNTADEAKRGER